MSDPVLALQAWLAATLKAAATGAGDAVFDSVPATDPFPRITLGPGQALPGEDDGQCAATWEIFQQVDVWSRAAGFPEAKTIAGQARAALHGATPALSGFAVPLFEWISTDFSRDPDGKTSRARLQFRALVDEA